MGGYEFNASKKTAAYPLGGNRGNNRFTLEVGAKDNLIIKATDTGKEDIEQGLVKDIYDVLESSGALGDGWCLVSPEDIGALTDAPIIGYGIDVDDRGNYSLRGSWVWWYPDYAITDPLEELKKNGEVIFSIA